MEKVKIRWTAREWRDFVARLAGNRHKYSFMKDRLADAMNAIEDERRRDITSIQSSTHPWREELKALEAQLEQAPDHIEGVADLPSEPFDITQVSDKVFYAEFVRRISLFGLQHASPTFLNMFGGSVKYPECVKSHFDDAPESALQTKEPEVKPKPIPTDKERFKLTLVGIYGKNQRSFTEQLGDYLQLTFCPPDARVESTFHSCEGADVIYIAVDRISHSIYDKLMSSFKGKKELHFVKGGVTSIVRDIKTRFKLI